MEITNKDFINVVSNFLDSYALQKDYITGLDSELGDGDHWVNLNSGFNMILREKKDLLDLDVKDFYKTIGMKLMQGIGGSSGVLLGGSFISVINCFGNQNVINENNFLCFWEAFESSIKKRGQVEYGQKTMLDPISLAIEKFNGNNSNDFNEKLESFLKGSNNGMEKTKEMEARKGRGRYHSNKGLGILDPGAVSMNLFIKEFIKEMRK